MKLLQATKSIGTDDERAVSPVIGVILMVAITVILAAVIATFVLGMGSQISKTAPQAIVQISDAQEPWDNATSNTPQEQLIRIEHGGGDSIPFADMAIVVKDPTTGEVYAKFDETNTYEASIDGDSADGEWVVAWNGTVIVSDAVTNGEFRSGDVLLIQEGAKGIQSGVQLAPGDTVTVALVHEPTGKTVSSSKVTIQ